MQGIFPTFLAGSLTSPHTKADTFASFSSFGRTSSQTTQGIFNRGAGNVWASSSEFPLAQQAQPEPWLGYEKGKAATAGITLAKAWDWVRKSTHGNTLESGPIRQSARPTPKTPSRVASTA
ncbi:MAG: hypothetical protein EON93_02035 [Burkholderiales bacterium]|nr:MAG: hypothetical protein EON93_02035 [Burkholderiales bacterium]